MARFHLLALPLLSALCSYQVDAARLRSLAEIPFLPAHRHLANCPITDGVDYVGNDLRHDWAYHPSDCCMLCSLTPNCGAFTWTNFEGGTCWLKTAKGRTVPNPEARSAELVADPATCSLKDDVDFQGNDIANVKNANAGACCQICATWPGCNAFSWSNFNDGTCWLKSAKGPEVSKSGVKSATVTNTVNQCSLQYDIDFVGNDIGNVPGSNPGVCCSICSSRSNCRAYTWSNHNGGTCWLKSWMGPTEAKTGAVSSFLQETLPESCTLESNTDYEGNDIGNVPAAKAEDCCAICRRTFNCNVFSWSNHQGGTCWLKYIRDRVISKSGVTSGTIE
ncbi:hypothetical protein PHYBOEH_003155 [Phytophthora boehmeriae]|uniref:Apple domain-containing protein n=1 Tax=Phytophthora boehmeriae TaxID=109152 RepID=A0A8T1WU61_9STRA|nr:hypothetical protein PHYBOEH_003155 [Phytophthora boehmeriae]